MTSEAPTAEPPSRAWAYRSRPLLGTRSSAARMEPESRDTKTLRRPTSCTPHAVRRSLAPKQCSESCRRLSTLCSSRLGTQISSRSRRGRAFEATWAPDRLGSVPTEPGAWANKSRFEAKQLKLSAGAAHIVGVACGDSPQRPLSALSNHSASSSAVNPLIIN